MGVFKGSAWVSLRLVSLAEQPSPVMSTMFKTKLFFGKEVGPHDNCDRTMLAELGLSRLSGCEESDVCILSEGVLVSWEPPTGQIPDCDAPSSH